MMTSSTPSTLTFRAALFLATLLCLWIVLILAILLFVGTVTFLESALGAQSFTEHQDVTATDILIEVVERGTQSLKPDFLARRFQADSYRILLDGEELSIVGLEVPDPENPAQDWTLVLYFDAALAERRTIRLAARELADRVHELIALGTVEVVVADPIPRRLVPPTRDSETVLTALSQLAIEGDSTHELLDWRADLVAGLDEAETAGEVLTHTERLAIASQVLLEERQTIRRRQDALTRFLIDGFASPGPDFGARRALFLIGGGFDLKPQDFYRQVLNIEETARIRPADWKPYAELDAWAGTLAAYGWITFPFAYPEPGEETDRMIGSLLRLPATVEHLERPVNPIAPYYETQWELVFNVLRFKIKEHRSPKKAEAYMEVGETRVARGDLDGAVEAFERAIYHFANHPKTTERQAEATRRLASVHIQRGAEGDGLASYREAENLAPGTVETPFARLLAPREPLERLAMVTSGQPIRDADALDATLLGLGQRIRLTYQLPEATSGSLHKLKVECLREDCKARGPLRARTSTLESVAAMRLRQAILGDGLIEGSLGLKMTHAPGSKTLDLDFDATSIHDLNGQTPWIDDLRLSLILADEEGEPFQIVHVYRAARPLGSDLRWRDRLELPEGDRGAAVWVLVEHLRSGRFGLAAAEL